MAKRKQKTKDPVSMEQMLWDAANKLRGKVESSEYKHVVLGLIFLKFASDKFEARRAKLIADGQEAFIDMVEFYNADNVFYLPEEAQWTTLMTNAKQDDVAVRIDAALRSAEKTNSALRGALPDANYYSRLDMDTAKLSALLDTVNNIDTRAEGGEDVVGRVYEYFLGRFAAAEGKGGGEFYTPRCIVDLLAEMLEPYRGIVYDPCCGSGGMFVQSHKFVESHTGGRADISVYGQEYTATTRKLAKMNLAVRGVTNDLGEGAADTFRDDQHPDLKADFVLANPPFNQKQWRGPNELLNDPRWGKYGAPAPSNANYAWILHMLSKLGERGAAGFVLANGSMSSQQSGEGELRRRLVEDDLVDCMVALPGQLFYTTQIPVCLWFLSKDKGAGSPDGAHPSQRRDRRGETLFIDARQLGSMLDRTHKELTRDDIARIAGTYHDWKQADSAYEDVAGYCRSADLTLMEKNDFVLTPGRYVGIPEEEDDGIPFEEKMAGLSAKLFEQFAEGRRLEEVIVGNLSGMGYGG